MHWPLSGVLIATAFTIAGVVAASAIESDYPSQPVKMIVPFTAGSATDILARGLAEQLSERWKQPVLVDNRPGATGIVAAEATTKSAPDGYTILFDGATTFASNMYLYPSLPFDTEKDLEPVTRVADLWLALVVRKSLPAENPKDFANLIGSGTGNYTYGTSGIGTSPNLVLEAYKVKTGARITHVPYKGSAETITDLLADRLDAMFVIVNSVATHVDAGSLKMIGYSGPQRLAAYPEVQTLREAGVPELDVGSFYGLAVPTGTPSNIIAKIAADAGNIVQSEQFQKKFLLPSGMKAVGDTPEQFKTFLVEARARMREFVKLSGIQLK
ncbi:tripartite tricarboxylate transporter substrate binding protein [Aminobacter sp. MSH1]|uniref:Bug family tripartite tricarboxylate transporter substrate binding protein n=1 Tax=Aminobacter sp. MSH1 TaxID=374606 RepID=UPI000D38E26B|nr:tripartite tricarboxylate transporter substrate binding protein [Aminobacter sp. MSH1]